MRGLRQASEKPTENGRGTSGKWGYNRWSQSTSKHGKEWLEKPHSSMPDGKGQQTIDEGEKRTRGAKGRTMSVTKQKKERAYATRREKTKPVTRGQNRSNEGRCAMTPTNVRSCNNRNLPWGMSRCEPIEKWRRCNTWETDKFRHISTRPKENGTEQASVSKLEGDTVLGAETAPKLFANRTANAKRVSQQIKSDRPNST